MTAVELLKAAKNKKLPPLIYLYGEEAFLLEECLNSLIDNTLAQADRDFNLLVVSGKDVDPNAIMDNARTFPLFAARRMIVVKQAQMLMANQLDILSSYIADPVEQCCLIFCADKIDKRKKFFQQFKKKGELIEFKPLYPNKIPDFVRQRLRSMGKQFSEDALELFCRRVGTNLSEIISELNKLVTYCANTNLIDTPDVAAVVSDSKIDSVFDLTDAIGSKNLSKACILLERLQDDGEAPLKILSMITRHFRQMWKANALVAQNSNRQEIARCIKINPFFVGEIIRQSKKISHSSYAHSFELFVQLDLALKSSGAVPRALLQQLAQDLIRLN